MRRECIVTMVMSCIEVELRKFFRSRVPLFTFLALLLVPFFGGFFMFVLKNPELAQSLGFISAKAQLIGSADWTSYLGLLAQSIAIGGLLVFGFVTSWVFGREFSDRTVNDLLVLPTSRNAIVLAKFAVATFWCVFLTLMVLFAGLAAGTLVGLSGWSPQLFTKGIVVYFVCSTLTILLSTPVGFIASVGRGYLSPLGFMIFTLALGQIVAVTGRGHIFPWSIPAIFSGVIADSNILIEVPGVIIVLITSIAGLMGTTLWWTYADHA